MTDRHHRNRNPCGRAGFEPAPGPTAPRPPARITPFSQSPSEPAAGRSIPRGPATRPQPAPGPAVYNHGMLLRSRLRLAWVSAALLALAAARVPAQVVVAPGVGAPPSAPIVPDQGHDLALEALADGGYRAALEAAAASYQTAMRFGAERWIDSIAAAGLLAECQYELGNFPEAVKYCEEAMLLQAVHAEWTLRVQYAAPGPAAPEPNVPWGRRPSVPLSLPDVMAIRHQPANPQQVLQRGGLLAAPFDTLVRPQVIVRSLATAIYRHREMLGELAPRSGPLAEVSRALANRAAPQDGYARAWLDTLLGITTWAQGKPRDAEPLIARGLMVDNRFDHVLTPWALIVRGRIAFDADRAADAAALFEDAAVAAEAARDARALEEALRLAYAAHMAAGTRAPPRSIAAAAEWAGEDVPVLRSRLFAMLAECLAVAGDARGATAALRRIDAGLVRGDAGRGALGAEAAYAAAINGYAAGRVSAGDADLERAVGLAAPRSPRLFQTAVLTELVAGGASGVTERQADDLFGTLLAGPSGRDFAAWPLESLTVASAARGEAFDTWVAVAAARNVDAALDAAEAATRARWLGTLIAGGRRIAIERLLDTAGPPADVAARRAALLGGRPELARVVDRMQTLSTALANGLGAAAAAAPGANPAADWTEYGRVVARRGELVAAIAAGRDPLPIDFPPLVKAAELRARLAPRQLMLSFHWTKSGLFGVLESRERTAVWQVLQAAALPGEIRRLAKDMCLFDPAAAVTTDKFRSRDWRPAAESVERLLFENSKIALGEGIDELVIVPDGWLWYLPFELLPATSGRRGADAAGPRLRDVCRIRYAPTRGLALMPPAPRPAGAIGLHAGRITRGEKPGASERLVQSVTQALDHTVTLEQPAAGGQPLPLVTASCEALAIFDEIHADEPRASRSLFAVAGKGGLRFADWLAVPAKRNRRVLLPGMQTAMAGGLAKTPARPGDELFLAASDIVAAGVPTAVLARWRVGGGVSAAIVTEFLRDTAPGTAVAPAEGWRRAVDLAIAERPDPETEPRIRQSGEIPLADASHPFFWAGYLLVACGATTDAAAPPPAR